MPNSWIIHVKKKQKQNPKLSYKQCMVKGKSTYKKQTGQGISDVFSSIWSGIKKVGKASAVAVIGIPLAVLASQASLMAYASAQPDGGKSLGHKGVKRLSTLKLSHVK